jgi:hypothetical protein
MNTEHMSALTPNKNVFETVSENTVNGYLTGNVRLAAEAIPDDIRCLTEVELENVYEPTHQDWLMRNQLWKALDLAMANGETEIQPVEIYRSVMDRGGFYRNVITNPHRFSWIMIRPIGLKPLFDDALQIALKKMRDYIVRNVVTDENARNFLKIAEFVANRSSLGPVTQKIAQANFNMDVQQTHQTDAGDISEKLKAFRQAISSEPKDVTPEEKTSTDEGFGDGLGSV